MSGGYSAVSGLGTVTAGQVGTIWHPRTPRKNTCGLILLPGQSNPKAYMDAVDQKATTRLAAALASAGIPTITSEFGGNSWGNDNAMTAITAAKVALQAAYPNMRTDKVCLLGTSMGGSAVTRYAQQNPTSVAAVVGLIPAYDPKEIYIYGNVGDAAMEAAWSFAGLVNFPDGLDVGPKYALASSVPIFSAYASNDDIVPAASVTGYHTNAGGLAENIVNVGALGHTDAALAAVPVPALAQFLASHGA